MQNLGKGHVGDVITGQLEGAFAANIECPALNGTIVFGKRSETIEQRKEIKKRASGVDAVEASHILVMLVKTADDQLDGVVGQRGEGVLDGIFEFGVVSLEEVEETLGLRVLSHIGLFGGHNGLIAFVDGFAGFGLEDLVDLLFEVLGFRMGLGVVVTVDFFDQALGPLESMEDTFVVLGLRENLADGVSIVLVHIGDNDPWLIALGFESLQKGVCLVGAVVREDFFRTILTHPDDNRIVSNVEIIDRIQHLTDTMVHLR